MIQVGRIFDYDAPCCLVGESAINKSEGIYECNFWEEASAIIYVCTGLSISATDRYLVQ